MTSGQVFFAGMGTAVPRPQITQQQLAEHAANCCARNAEQKSRLFSIYKNTSIQKRSSILVGQAESLKDDATDTVDVIQSLGDFYVPNQVDGERGPTVEQRIGNDPLHRPAVLKVKRA